MPPIPLLTKLDLLKENKTVLDVGTKDGKIANQLAAIGMEVDAIDTQPLAEVSTTINFEQISIEDFLERNTKQYDLIVARHVLPFTNNPLLVIKRLNSIAGIFVFTCFGEKDEWKNKDHISTVTKEELVEMFEPHTVRHYSETFEHTTTYAGEQKYWHYHTLVIDNR